MTVREGLQILIVDRVALGLVEVVSEAKSRGLFLRLDDDVVELLDEGVHLLVDLLSFDRFDRFSLIEGVDTGGDAVHRGCSVNRSKAAFHQVDVVPRDAGAEVLGLLRRVGCFHMGPDVLHAVDVWAVGEIVD